MHFGFVSIGVFLCDFLRMGEEFEQREGGSAEEIEEAEFFPQMVQQRGVRRAVSRLQGGGEPSLALGQRGAAIIQLQLQELLVAVKIGIRLKYLAMELAGRTQEPGGNGQTF